MRSGKLMYKIAGLFLLSLCGMACGTTSSSCNIATVATTSGPVCGKSLTLSAGVSLSNTAIVYAYLGIPYAKAPTGGLRFMPPEAYPKSAGTINTTQFSPICPQSGSVPAFFQPVNGTSEDCLTLNIWRPETATISNHIPVMFWIHGGQYVRHGSGINGWDGEMLAAREKVVVVSINYRLGALGFLYDAADGIRGNMGLKDQQLAMQWVQDNIANFGGDPDKVTLFGWSAGAISVTAHALSIPSSRPTTPYFRAIMSQSNLLGSKLNASGSAAVTTLTNTFLTSVCPGISAGSALSCLQSASIASILTAQSAAGSFFPIVDDSFLVRQAIAGASAGLLNMPAVIGNVQSEGNLFVAENINATTLSSTEYEQKVTDLFGATDAAKVLATSPYIPTSGGNNITQYQLVETDYLFGCPARYLASKASSSVFIYIFPEVPNDNINWNTSTDPSCTGAVCLACQSAACHGDDLAFLFNSVPLVNTGPPIPDVLLQTLNTSQQTVANAMQDFWGNFTKNLDPGVAGGVIWPLFTNGGTYIQFGCSGSGCSPTLSTTTAVPFNKCTTFWDTQIGYEGLAPGS